MDVDDGMMGHQPGPDLSSSLEEVSTRLSLVNNANTRFSLVRWRSAPASAASASWPRPPERVSVIFLEVTLTGQ